MAPAPFKPQTQPSSCSNVLGSSTGSSTGLSRLSTPVAGSGWSSSPLSLNTHMCPALRPPRLRTSAAAARTAGPTGKLGLKPGAVAPAPAAAAAAARSARHAQTSSLRLKTVAAAQRRRLFGGDSGGSWTGSTSSSSDGDDDGDDQDARLYQQQQQQQQQQQKQKRQLQQRQAAVKARLEVSMARLKLLEDKGLIRPGLIKQALNQMLTKEVVADATDIVSASPATLRRQLAQQGTNLEADWAEAEGTAASAAASTTTGRAKSLAARAAAAGLTANDLLRLERPAASPEPMGFLDNGYSSYEDDEGNWSDILDYDDPSFWEDRDVIGRRDDSWTTSAPTVDPTVAAAAAIRREMNTPEFQAFLRREEQRKAAEAARAAKQAEVDRAAAATAGAAARLQQKQRAVDLTKLQSQLLQQQQQPQGPQRPLLRPGASASRPLRNNDIIGQEDDIILDPNDIRSSDVGLTPSEMAALLQDLDAGSGSSSSSGRQAPVFHPKSGYGYSNQAQAAAGRLAAAAAAGQLNSPLLVRPAFRPTASGAGAAAMDPQQFWDAKDAAAAATAAKEAERKAFIASLLAEQAAAAPPSALPQQQQQQQQRWQQQAALVRPAHPASSAATAAPVAPAQASKGSAAAPVIPPGADAAAQRLKQAVLNAQLSRPARPGAAPAAAGIKQPLAPTSGISPAAATRPGALQRPQMPGISRPQQQQMPAGAGPGEEEGEEIWDEEEAAEAAAAQQEAARLELLAQLAAEAEASAQQQTKPAKPSTLANSSSGKKAALVQQLQDKALPKFGLRKPPSRPAAGAAPKGAPKGASKAAAASATTAADRQQQDDVYGPDVGVQDEPWDAEEAATIAAAEAEADLLDLISQLAVEAEQASAAADDAVPAPAADASTREAASSLKKLELDVLASKLGKQGSPTVFGLKRPPSRPANQQAQETPQPADANSSQHQQKQKQQQQRKPRAGLGSVKQPPKQQGKQPEKQQQAVLEAVGTEPPQEGGSKEQHPGLEALAEQQAERQPADKQSTYSRRVEALAEAARLRAQYEQAASDAAAAAAAAASAKVLNRPNMPQQSSLLDTTASEAAGKRSNRAQDSNSNRSARQPRQQRNTVVAPALPKAAEAADWRWSGSDGGGSSSSSNSSMRQRSGADARSWSGSVQPDRIRLPRTVPEGKVPLALELERTRNSTVATVVGVAGQWRWPGLSLSLIVRLEELGCVTLLPFAQLLPSQQAEAIRQATARVAETLRLRGLHFGAMRLMGLMDMAEELPRVLKEWRGRKLDVIIAATRQPEHFIDRVKWATAPLETETWQLRRFSKTFYKGIFTGLQIPGFEVLRAPAMQEQQNSTGAAEKDAAAAVAAVADLVAAQAEAEAISLGGQQLGAQLLQSLLPFMYDSQPTQNLPYDDEHLKILHMQSKLGNMNTALAIHAVRKALLQMGEQGLLSGSLRDSLMVPVDQPREMFVRCVAVATWPPAWLSPEQQQELLLQQQPAQSADMAKSDSADSSGGDGGGGSSGSPSTAGGCLWVEQGSRLVGPPPSYSRAQAHLWDKHERRQGKASGSSRTSHFAVVVGVHPAGYLLCQEPCSTLDSPHSFKSAGATFAVPLSSCPVELNLSALLQSQPGAPAVEAATEPAAAVGRMNSSASSARKLPELGSSSITSNYSLHLYHEVEQPRWKAWDLSRQHTTAPAQSAAQPEHKQLLQSAPGMSVAALDAAELTAWRMGALGLWERPYLSVNLKLLPLEQQLDPAALSEAAAALGPDPSRARTAGLALDDDQPGLPKGDDADCHVGPVAANLPLLACIVQPKVQEEQHEWWEISAEDADNAV